MNPLRILLGLVAIAAIFIAAFYAYSNLSRKTADGQTETATIVDLINKDKPLGVDDGKIVHAQATTTPRLSLEGFKENELRKGLDSIKAGLELLQNPFE